MLASDRGGLPELVGEDAVLAASNREAWASSLADLWHNPAVRAERGAAALARARERFGEDRFYEGLIRLYGAVSA